MRLQQSRYVSQQPVPGGVPTGVVDDLELIQVDVQQRVRTFMALRALQCFSQPVVELAPIDQPGQRVVARLIGQRPLEPALLGDVAKYDHRTDDVAGAVADGRRRILDRYLLSQPVQQHAVFGEVHQLAFTQTAHQRILQLSCVTSSSSRSTVPRLSPRASSLPHPESCSATGFM